MATLTGKWKCCIHTYMGDMFSELDLVAEGDTLTGTATDSANGAKGELAGGKIGYDLTIRAVVGELTNHIEGVLVDENTINGKSKNPMGEFDMEAHRI